MFIVPTGHTKCHHRRSHCWVCCKSEGDIIIQINQRDLSLSERFGGTVGHKIVELEPDSRSERESDETRKHEPLQQRHVISFISELFSGSANQWAEEVIEAQAYEISTCFKFMIVVWSFAEVINFAVASSLNPALKSKVALSMAPSLVPGFFLATEKAQHGIIPWIWSTGADHGVSGYIPAITNYGRICIVADKPVHPARANHPALVAAIRIKFCNAALLGPQWRWILLSTCLSRSSGWRKL